MIDLRTILERQNYPEVLTIRQGVLLTEAVKLLSQYNIGALPVVTNDETVIGILSERDVIRAINENTGSVTDLLVKDYMTQSVVTAALDTTVDSANIMMKQGRFRHLPVVDEDGKIVGMFSISDLLTELVAIVEKNAQEKAQLAQHLQDYINSTG